jgi:hypothetical protein
MPDRSDKRPRRSARPAGRPVALPSNEPAVHVGTCPAHTEKGEQFAEVARNWRRLKSKIAPFVKPRDRRHYSTAGQWQSTRMAAARPVKLVRPATPRRPPEEDKMTSVGQAIKALIDGAASALDLSPGAPVPVSPSVGIDRHWRATGAYLWQGVETHRQIYESQQPLFDAQGLSIER